MHSFEKSGEILPPREHPAREVSRVIDRIAALRDEASEEALPQIERVLEALYPLEATLEREQPKEVN